MNQPVSQERYVNFYTDQKDFWDLFAVTETAEKKGRAEGMAEGMAKGMAKGKAEGRAEMFRTMYRKGMSAEQIAEMTSTDMEEVQEAIKDA